MTDQEYVAMSFYRNFSAYKNKEIILYGVGVNTKALLEALPEYRTAIVGLMDQKRTGQEFYGKRVLSEAEVAAIRPDIIVVVARLKSCRLIYGRLADFCREHGIPLYGINGQDLFCFFGAGRILTRNGDYYQVTEPRLRAEIMAHDVVSFSVMDVLLMRRTWDAADFAAAVERSVDVTACRRALLVPRRQMMELFHWAIAQGKRVMLFYAGELPRDVMELLLRHFGITGYVALALECENGGSELRRIADGVSWLHVAADEVPADFTAGGAAVFLIQSARAMLAMSTYRSLPEYFRSANDRALAGLFISEAFNDPFALAGVEDGRLMVRESYLIGWLFFAPMAAALVLWLINEVRQQKFDGTIFAARDGYMVQKLYHIALTALGIDDMPPDFYVQASRILCWKMNIEEEADLQRICRNLGVRQPETMLRRIFEVPDSLVHTWDKRAFSTIEAYLISYLPAIRDKSRVVRENYQRYLERLGLRAGNRYAFFDFVSRGTCQYWLSKVFAGELYGVYAGRYHRQDEEPVETAPIDALYEEYHDYMPETYLMQHYVDAEQVYSSPDPSAYSMDAEGQPVCYPDLRTPDELHYLADVQRAVEDFFRIFVTYMYVPGVSMNKSMADKMYAFMSLAYTDEECRERDAIMLDDVLGMGREYLDTAQRTTRLEAE